MHCSVLTCADVLHCLQTAFPAPSTPTTVQHSRVWQWDRIHTTLVSKDTSSQITQGCVCGAGGQQGILSTCGAACQQYIHSMVCTNVTAAGSTTCSSISESSKLARPVAAGAWKRRSAAQWKQRKAPACTRQPAFRALAA